MTVLSIRGAREHNLRGVDLDLPRERLIVFTGVSGSGKTSLAFDTLFAESQRRFVEALAPGARGRFGPMHKPGFDLLTGLAPAIGLSQRGLGAPSPRSTVGTLTEIHDLLRVWWSRQGTMFCPRCHDPLQLASFDTITRTLVALPEGAMVVVGAPIARGRVGPLGPLLREVAQSGFTRVRVDGQPVAVDDPHPAPDGKPHDVDVVVDRIRAGPGRGERFQDAVGLALKAGQGAVVAVIDGVAHTWTTQPRCVRCALGLPALTPRLFSFNAPVGACPQCEGLGVVASISPDGVVVDPERSVSEGAVRGGKKVVEAARGLGIDVDAPWREVSWEDRDRLLNGEGEWEGASSLLLRKAASSRSADRKHVHETVCPQCAGGRLGPVARGVQLDGKSLPAVLEMTLPTMHEWMSRVTPLADVYHLHEELLRRVSFLRRSGLDHLSLSRSAVSLSAGELQRVRLAAQAGNQLSGVLYVLDEPTAGLHPADTRALIQLLLELRDAGNTVLVVEHDPDVIGAADVVVDFGPGAGADGGSVVYQGSPEGLLSSDTQTGRWLAGKEDVDAPVALPRSGVLRLRGASGHNLQGLDLDLPLHAVVGITGRSGAGKSSLILDTLCPALGAALGGTERPGLPFTSVDPGGLRRLVAGGGTGFGRSGRANVLTATRVWDEVRELYARTPEARLRGFGPERFSFNLPGGRCESCAGEGVRHVDLALLPAMTLPCEVCDGKRYDEATLAVTWRGASIADLLSLRVREARPLFGHHRALGLVLDTLDALGLGYLPLGQPADTWSGGEAQRVRLARELGRPGEIADTLYVLDEPSVGLHPYDVAHLLTAFRRLVKEGASVLVVEHDPVVLRGCDWIVELGPGAGAAGGRIVAAGTVASLRADPNSITGPYLSAPARRP